MGYKLEELARLVGGKVEGDGAVEISAINTLDQAGGGELSFVTNPRYRKLGLKSKAEALLVPAGTAWPGTKALIAHEEPYLALAKLLEVFFPDESPPRGIDPTSVIGEGSNVEYDAFVGRHVTIGKLCTLGRRVRLDAGVVVGDNVLIGDDTRIFPNVTVYSGVIIGERVRIHSGTVIGSDGFGYARDGERYVKVPQVGGVILGDDVEIGANVTIDRGTLGDTKIETGVKIDNLVQIAHNVEIGRNTVIAAMTGISGSAKIGEGVTFAGQAATAGHVKVGDRCVVTGKAGVTKDIPPDRIVSGVPATDHNRWRRAQVLSGRLPEFLERIKVLEDEVRRLRQRKTQPDSSAELK
ncbi:UDP-3-O-(3-hydroxymyristoyl)glucosamine N-acyltransferase [Acidobacteriota bacterium]